MNWEFFRADNSSDGGSQSSGLNYVNLPLFFEYTVGYHQGKTRASSTRGTTTYRGRINPDGSVTVTETNTPGTYYRGGDKTSAGMLLYAGPQIGYLFKLFNYSGNPIRDTKLNKNDTKLNKNNVAFVIGLTFWLHQISLDFSYQKGLTSIYSGKNVTIDGFLLKLGINFKERLYNK